MQETSDIFLGWTTGELAGINYYLRQLRDWKGSVEVEADGVTPEQLGFYAGLCGMTLARGHARSGDAVAISSYAGKGDTLDRAIVAFAGAISCTICHATFRKCAANAASTPAGTNVSVSGDSLKRKPYHTSAPRYSPVALAWLASFVSFFAALHR